MATTLRVILALTLLLSLTACFCYIRALSYHEVPFLGLATSKSISMNSTNTTSTSTATGSVITKTVVEYRTVYQTITVPVTVTSTTLVTVTVGVPPGAAILAYVVIAIAASLSGYYIAHRRGQSSQR